MNFSDVGSSSLLYVLVMIGLVLIVMYAAIFLKKSYTRSLDLGFSKEEVMNVIKSSLVFTVIPSIAIVIGLFSLTLALGIPWPWWRLSVIGSVGYELMAADMTGKAMGFATMPAMAASPDPSTFTAIMYVMTAGIIGGVLVLIVFGKKMTTGLMKAKEDGKSTWGTVMNASFMLTLTAVFTPIMIFSDKIGAATLATSAVITMILGILIKKFNLTWLNNFVLAITLILSMIASVGWQALLL